MNTQSALQAPALDGEDPIPSSLDQRGLNLLDLPLFRACLQWRGFPYVFQALLLGVFIGLAAMAWGLHTPAGVNAKLYAKSNLVTLLVWGLWWPAMVWGAVLLGRVWCAVCPLELVSNVSERLGRRLGIRQRTLSRGLAAGGMIVALYALLQLLVSAAQLHRTPAYTAWFLVGLILLASLTGWLWNDRAFCRAFCPVGLLLGTYGRGGMLAVRAGPESICQRCPSRDCLKEGHRTRADARSCPSLLQPPKLNSNQDCLLCGQCLKACQPNNMQFLLRPWFSKFDRREPQASWPVTLFVMLVSGFVTWELCTEWKAAEKVFLAVPNGVAGFMGISSTSAISGILKWLWALVIVPLFGWLSLAGLYRIFERRHWGEILCALALPIAVLVAAGHMSKGLAKFVSWAPFLPGALRDPEGIVTAQAITAKTAVSPGALLSLPTVSIVCLALIMTAFLFAVREHRLAQPDKALRLRSILPLSLMALAYVFIIAGWSRH